MKKQKGFTLIELLVTLVLVVIVSGVMYALYKAQNQTTIAQGHVADMQQTLRASADILTREIRMAGYDPEETGNYEITEATATSMKFTADNCENGGTAENGTLSFSRMLADGTVHTETERCTETFFIQLYDGGDADDKKEELRRTAGGQPIAENIEQFELCYFTGGDTCETPASGGKIANQNSIDGVVFSMLVRSAREDSSYKNSKTYKPGSHEANFGKSGVTTTWGPKNDGYRRRLIVKRIQLRNMGL